MADTVAGRRKRGLPTQAKAKVMMHEGTIKGHPMTPSQRGLFGMIAGGEEPTRMKGSRRKRKGSRGGY
jgi:hypothetical protein